jgi:hypothetical protein
MRIRGARSHGEISSLVHSFGVLLAAGAGGVGAVSACVVATPAVPNRWHRSGWGSGTGESNHLSPGAGAKGGLRLRASSTLPQTKHERGPMNGASLALEDKVALIKTGRRRDKRFLGLPVVRLRRYGKVQWIGPWIPHFPRYRGIVTHEPRPGYRARGANQ